MLLLVKFAGRLRRTAQGLFLRPAQRARAYGKVGPQAADTVRDDQTISSHFGRLAQSQGPTARSCKQSSLGQEIRTRCCLLVSKRSCYAFGLAFAVLLVQFSVNFGFAQCGMPAVFNQRQLVTILFNTSLSYLPNSSSDVHEKPSNLSCPGRGQAFEVIPSTMKSSGDTDSFYNYNGAVTLPLFVLFLLSRLILTPLALQVPMVPSGLFTPIFLLGALIGRAWGVLSACLLQMIHASNGDALMNTTDGQVVFTEISAAEYAVLGAAAFAGATTRTISTVIIVLELTGSMYLQLPVAVCVLAAYFIADRISPSVYELMQALESLPVLPSVVESLANYRASDMMQRVGEQDVIVPPLTIGQARRLLHTSQGGEIQFFAVVDTIEHMILIGEVQRMLLATTVLEYDERASASGGAQRRRSTRASTYGSLGSTLTETGRQRPGDLDYDDATKILLVASSCPTEVPGYLRPEDRPFVTRAEAKTLRRRAGNGRVPAAKILSVPLDLAPLQLPWSTPLYRVNLLVHMLRM